MGRKSPYKLEYANEARSLCEAGATDQDLAEHFGVCRRTITSWISSRPEFANAVRAGKEPADERVLRSLYHRALGYSHPDVDIRVIDGKIVQTEITKYCPPDTTACIFWLKNRRPAEWRDKQETGFTDKDGNDLAFQVTLIPPKNED